MKYLGQFLTNELSDDIDIRRQCRGNILDPPLCRKFHICYMCSVPVKLKLFNSYCSSLYTPHLWWNYKKISVSKLQITFHNMLKMNIGLSKYDSTSATCAFSNFTNTQCCQSTIRNLIGKAHKNCIIGQKCCLHHITGMAFIIRLKLYAYIVENSETFQKIYSFMHFK